MASVKQEPEELDHYSDSWLFHWSNLKTEAQNDKKPILSDLESDVKVENNKKNRKRKSERHKQTHDGVPKAQDDLKIKNNKYGIKRKDLAFESENASLNTKIESDCEEDNVKKSKNLSKSSVEKLQEYECKNGNKSRNSTLKEAVDKAPLSDNMANLCKYKCPKCFKVFPSSQKIGIHFKESSHATLSRKQTTFKYIIEVAAYRCLLCMEKMLCDKQTIKGHVAYKHQLTLTSYSAKMNVAFEGRRSRPINELEHFCKTYTSKHSTTNQIGNLCKFSCFKCMFCCSSWKKN